MILLAAFEIQPYIMFWIAVYAATITVLALAIIWWQYSRLHSGRRVTWDMRSEYIDVAEFSNRNIPLKVTYKGAEPRWLWATYLSLRNTGRMDIVSNDNPDRQHFIVGAEGCRYIGFNRLISDKAKVTLSPLFRGNDVYCKIEFDRLGPGDEMLMSLLFVADDKHDVELQGALFGADSQIASGSQQRMHSWRRLWWLLIGMVLVGLVCGSIFWHQAVTQQQQVLVQFQTLGVIYCLALATAAVLLRPIRSWQQLPERFQDPPERQKFSLWNFLQFIFGWRNEL